MGSKKRCADVQITNVQIRLSEKDLVAAHDSYRNSKLVIEKEVDQLEFSKIINNILWADWDPIGCGVPEDEYEGYVPAILSLLLRNASVEEIGERLHHVETVNIGLKGNKDHCRQIAKKLIAEKAARY